MRYDKMVETALRGVVREALTGAAKQGLPGNHHFYVTFKTRFPGVGIADYLAARYPDEMTIVLEHQFWDLTVEDARFSVTLSFSNKPERLTIPFAAVTAFADPSVKFGLQFQETEAPAEAGEPKKDGPKLRLAETRTNEANLPASTAEPAKAEEKKPGGGEVVTLDQFRKK